LVLTPVGGQTRVSDVNADEGNLYENVKSQRWP
jgi:hypothetical protein